MFRKIRWRLLATYLVVIVLALSFLGVHLMRDSEARYLAQVEASLLAQARLIALHVSVAVAAGDPARIREELQGTAHPSNPAVVVVDRGGQVLATSAADPRLQTSAAAGREGIPAALAGRASAGRARVGDVQVVYGAVPIRAGTEVVGAVHLVLPLVELTTQFRHIRAVVGWTILATLLWAAVVSFLLAQRIAGPIQEMRTATARIAAGALGQRVPVRTQDELGDLARSLNSMAAELERLDAMRREFVADASHELRTPVANLSVAVQALRADLPALDPATSPLLDAIDREMERLRVLVDTLLDLSAIESGHVQLSMRPTNLAEIVHRLIDSFRARADQRRITLAQVVPGRPVWAPADPDRIAQVLSNLVDNAVKFTPPGGHVTISIGEHRGKAVISVEDTGPGIPPDDLPHIFDRFFKADRSRSGARGAGLGLAIAKRLVTMQGGQLSAENRREGGARFTVTLPSS
jgi:signal transduction histidine kinase